MTRIAIIDGAADRREHEGLVRAMLRQRARVFGPKGLGWDVRIVDGMERDILDDATPVYVIATDRERVTGSLRLLPTTGPTLVELAFPGSMRVRINSPEIWEMSRLCADGVPVLLALFDAVGKVAKRAHVTSIIGNISSTHVALYRHLGFPVDILGKQGDVLLVSMPLNRTHAAVINIRDRIR
jgi:N-acyl-L-homoserine lactone synthetase